MWDPDGRIVPAQYDHEQELNIGLGSQQRKLPFEQIVGTTVMQRRLAVLAPYKKP